MAEIWPKVTKKQAEAILIIKGFNNKGVYYAQTSGKGQHIVNLCTKFLCKTANQAVPQ